MKNNEDEPFLDFASTGRSAGRLTSDETSTRRVRYNEQLLTFVFFVVGAGGSIYFPDIKRAQRDLIT